MRLTGKLTIALTFAVLIVLGIHSIQRVSREISLFERHMRHDNRILGHAVARAAGRIYLTVGEDPARDLVREANDAESPVTIRWIWLDAPPGDVRQPFAPVPSLAPIRRGDDVVVRLRPPGQPEDALYVYVPVDVPNGRPVAIELKESLAEEQDYIHQTITQAVATTAILVLVCASVALGLGFLFVGRPVAKLVRMARRIGQGDLSTRERLRQRDEIGVLAREIDAMCDRLATARDRVAAETAARMAAHEQVQHANRLATVGKLGAGIAHELGTPLNVISGNAQLIIDSYEPGSPAHVNAITIGEQAGRVTKIVRQLLDFARRRSPQKTVQDLRTLVQHAADLLGPMAQARQIRIDIEATSVELFADVDTGQVQQAVTNLILNAIQASPAGTTIEVSLARRRPKLIEIAIVDHGTGIAPEVLPRVFEPFFTTKGVGEGTGLGLSVTYGIINEHGGSIEVDSDVGHGSRFRVYLPEAPR